MKVAVRADWGVHSSGSKFYSTLLVAGGDKSYVIKVHGAVGAKGRIMVEPYGTQVAGVRSYNDIRHKKGKPGEYTLSTASEIMTTFETETLTSDDVVKFLQTHAQSNILTYSKELYDAIKYVAGENKMDGPWESEEAPSLKPKLAIEKPMSEGYGTW